MIDSGSVVSLVTKTLANRIVRTTPSAKWITTKQDKDLKTFPNEPMKKLGKLGWTCKEAGLTVVEDAHKLIIGRDLFISLDQAVVQQQAESGKCVNNIDNSARRTFTAKHQKGRRVPINQQARVTVELDQLQKEGYIEIYLVALKIISHPQ